MRHFYSLFTVIVLLGTIAANAQKKLVIIGSSTSTCAFGLNSPAECYVTKLSNYYNQQVPNDTTIDNHLARGGTNCYNGMPSSYTPPYPDVAYQPITDSNITAALALNPDVIIVNYPTNAYDVLSVAEIMYCLRTIRDSANIKGVPCFITTTQPRTSPASFNTSPVKAKLAELKDSILLEFGNFAIDFWTGLINPADTSILYDSGDNIHMNAAGHDILFQRVVAANVFMATLPATFLQFNTLYKNNTNIISWLTAQESNIAYYEIQRSSDGIAFAKIGTVSASNSAGNNEYHYTDAQVLKGITYYKILIVDKDGKKHASPVMSVYINAGKLSIVKAFARSASQVVVELQNNEPQAVQLELLNNMGMVISRENRKIEAGSSSIYLGTPLLSNGVYHIRINGAQVSLVSSFIKN
jgi:hypothetical protein